MAAKKKTTRKPAVRKKASRRKPGPKPDDPQLAELEGDEKSDRLVAGGTVDERAELRKWTVEFRKAKALKETLAVKAMRGEMIPRSDVEQILRGTIGLAKRNLMSLGRRVALELVGMGPREIQERIEDEVRGILAEMAREARIRD